MILQPFGIQYVVTSTTFYENRNIQDKWVFVLEIIISRMGYFYISNDPPTIYGNPIPNMIRTIRFRCCRSHINVLAQQRAIIAFYCKSCWRDNQFFIDYNWATQGICIDYLLLATHNNNNTLICHSYSASLCISNNYEICNIQKCKPTNVILIT